MGLAGFNRMRLRQLSIPVGELEAPPTIEEEYIAPEKEFVCEVCGKGFDKVQGILGHYRKAHPDAHDAYNRISAQ